MGEQPKIRFPVFLLAPRADLESQSPLPLVKFKDKTAWIVTRIDGERALFVFTTRELASEFAVHNDDLGELAILELSREDFLDVLRGYEETPRIAMDYGSPDQRQCPSLALRNYILSLPV